MKRRDHSLGSFGLALVGILACAIVLACGSTTTTASDAGTPEGGGAAQASDAGDASDARIDDRVCKTTESVDEDDWIEAKNERCCGDGLVFTDIAIVSDAGTCIDPAP